MGVPPQDISPAMVPKASPLDRPRGRAGVKDYESQGLPAALDETVAGEKVVLQIVDDGSAVAFPEPTTFDCEVILLGGGIAQEQAENPSASVIEDYPWELKAGLSAPEVKLYKQVREECLGESPRSLVKDYFFADYGTIDPAENYWAALVEFPPDFDNSHPVFEGAVGAVVRGPSGNNYEVSSNASGQVKFFGPMELAMERASFIEWKEDRY
jgi:hypothetical protein